MIKIRNKRFILCLCLLCIWVPATICDAGPKRTMDVSQFGLMEIPDNLIVVDGNDVLKSMAASFVYLEEVMGNEKPEDKISAEKINEASAEMERYAQEFGVGLYQLALRDQGSYYTAVMFAVKLPREIYVDVMKMQREIEHMDRAEQLELAAMAKRRINLNLFTFLGSNDFGLEIMEVYPIEYKVTDHMKYTSVGGSVALRSFKIISPYAFKVYLVQSESGMHLIGLASDGTQRGVWNKVVGKMLDSVQFKSALIRNKQAAQDEKLL